MATQILPEQAGTQHSWGYEEISRKYPDIPDLSKFDAGIRMPDLSKFDAGFTMPQINLEKFGIIKNDTAVDSQQAADHDTTLLATILEPEEKSERTTAQPANPNTIEITGRTTTREKPRTHRVRNFVGGVALVAVAYAGPPLIQSWLQKPPAATATAPDSAPKPTTQEEQPTQTSTPTTEATTTTTTTAPELIEKAGPLKIRPKPNFLTPEGALVEPDYVLSLPTTGVTILGFERPQEEGDLIGTGVNKSVLDTLTAAQTPQQRTPQVEAYAAAHPEFTPPWESFWKGHRTSDLQPTAMHQFSMQDDLPLSPYPGQPGGSSYFEVHYKTYGGGGRTFRTLNPGDPLEFTRTIDNNKYTFGYVEEETIEVNKNTGALTAAEVTRQMARGYGADVTFDQIARTWKGHEDQITVTVQACNGSSERKLYRFVLVDQKLTTKYTS